MGEILLDEEPLRHNLLISRSNRLSQFGAILEGNRNLYHQLNLLDNAKYFGRAKGLSRSKAMEQALSMADEYGLPANQKVGQFSRGM